MFKTLYTYIPFLFLVLLFLSYVLPAKFKTRGQAIWLMVLLFGCAKFFFFQHLGGDAFAPELPAKVIWFWDWMYSGAVILMTLALAWRMGPMLVRGLVRRLRGVVEEPPPPACALFVWRWILPICAYAAAAIGIWNGVKLPKIVEYEVRSPNVSDELDGYRILQLTDLHVSSAAPRERTQAIVEMANAANPDLIVVTGDIVDGYVCDQRKNVEPLRKLVAKDGVLWITGNHEYYWNWYKWSALYDQWGFRFLNEEWVEPHPGLCVAGLDDMAKVQMGYTAEFCDVKEFVKTLPKDKFKVLLQHRPCAPFENEPGGGVDLQLSGHTHGGVAPGMDLLVKRANGGFVRGLYSLLTGDELYVSTGAGQWAGFPIRFFDDPEIAIFTLRKK